MTKAKSAAVKVAGAVADRNDPVQLSTGYWIRIKPVSASLIDEAQSVIQEPEVPTYYIEEKDRHEPNPADPAYLRALERLDVERAIAAADTIILFGVDLINEDGSPMAVEMGDWIDKLRFLERRGQMDLSVYDFDNALDREFVFKKYIAVAAPDFMIISEASGIREEDIDRAKRSFKSN
jgi:hypothetical protein